MRSAVAPHGWTSSGRCSRYHFCDDWSRALYKGAIFWSSLLAGSYGRPSRLLCPARLSGFKSHCEGTATTSRESYHLMCYSEEDIDNFWMSQYHGRLRERFCPPGSRLKDIKVSKLLCMTKRHGGLACVLALCNGSRTGLKVPRKQECIIHSQDCLSS